MVDGYVCPYDALLAECEQMAETLAIAGATALAMAIRSAASAIETDNYHEIVLREDLVMAHGIIDKYTRIWAERSPTKIRRRLVALRAVWGMALCVKGSVAIGTRVTAVLEENFGALTNTKYLISVPRHSSDQVVAAAIRDRNAYRSAVADILQGLEHLVRDGLFALRIKTLKALLETPEDMLAKLNEIRAAFEATEDAPDIEANDDDDVGADLVVPCAGDVAAAPVGGGGAAGNE